MSVGRDTVETLVEAQHHPKDHPGVIGWAAFVICLVLFAVCALFNFQFGGPPDSVHPESTWMVLWLFLIPLIAQGIGLWKLYHRHDRPRFFFYFYLTTMTACLLTYIACWFVYASPYRTLQIFSLLALASIGLLTGLSVFMTWAIIRQGSKDDGGWLGKWLRDLSSSISEEKPVTLLFFFTVFLSVAYLFGFALAFHDREQSLSGKPALFMKNVDKTTESTIDSKSSDSGTAKIPSSGTENAYKLTDLSLICLKVKGLSSSVLDKLKTIKDLPRPSESEFQLAVKTCTGGSEKEIEKGISTITNEARNRNRFVFQFDSNRAQLAIEDAKDTKIVPTKGNGDNERKRGLRTDNYKMMQGVVERITQSGRVNQHLRISLIGHADENATLGSAYQSNYELGEARADNVRIAIMEELSKKRDIAWQNLQWENSSASNEPDVAALKDEIDMNENRPVGRIVIAALDTFNEQSVPEFKEMSLIDYIYFANYTITTTGYGDIVPNTAYAKFLCSVANIFEVFFLVVLFNAVLSLNSLRPQVEVEHLSAGMQSMNSSLESIMKELGVVPGASTATRLAETDRKTHGET